MWIALSRKKWGTYVNLRYDGKTFSLGKLPEYDPTGLLDLVLDARKRTRSVTILKALRDADKSLRY